MYMSTPPVASLTASDALKCSVFRGVFVREKARYPSCTTLCDVTTSRQRASSQDMVCTARAANYSSTSCPFLRTSSCCLCISPPPWRKQLGSPLFPCRPEQRTHYGQPRTSHCFTVTFYSRWMERTHHVVSHHIHPSTTTNNIKQQYPKSITTVLSTLYPALIS